MISAPATPGPERNPQHLQQATLGLRTGYPWFAVPSAARRGGGNYPQALIDFLLVEVAMMLLLGPSRCGYAIISTDSRRRWPRNTGGGNLHNSYPAVITPLDIQETLCRN